LVSLAVHTAGAAIPADLLPSVFEPPARAQEESTARSIGLGLFIARTIVLAHGGDIQVSSSTGTGTTFTVVLPKASQ
jgi:phosphoserine phosphatase RsbU/P